MRLDFGLRRLRFVAITSAIAVVLALVATPAFAAPYKVRIPKPQRVRMLPHSVRTSRRQSAASRPSNPRPSATAWPSPVSGSATIAAGTTGLVSAGATSVRLAGVSKGRGNGRTLRVSRLPEAASAAARIPGPIFEISGDLGVPTRVAVDYAAFRNLGGANWGNRLHLVELPACVLTTPKVPRCQIATPVASQNNGAGSVQATVAAITPVPEASSATNTTPPSTRTGGTAQTTPTARAPNTRAASTMVMAVQAGTSGSNGAFSATSLAPSGSWSVGGSTGSFNWSYPVASPPPGTGADVAPKVSLDYNSAAVDGRITTTNNQSSLVGEGWDYDPGYVERTYRTCSTDKTLPSASQTQDLCWAGNIVTVHLPGGPTEPLVLDGNNTTANVWHPQNDNGERVTLCTSASTASPCVSGGIANGARNDEYWVITTTDGTQYTFGRNILPGGTSSNESHSVWTVPVYGGHSGDPCYSSSGFASSRCTQAWRWNLDLVQDSNSNAAAYYYAPETNFYGANKSTTGIAYTRDGYLSHIDYGLTASNVYATTAPETITFGVAERCIPSGTITCSDSQFTTAADASYWPDTPADLNCAAPPATCNTHAPSFWTRKHYTTITTKYWNGTAYQPVDSYALSQNFPNTGDPEMALNTVVRTSYQAGGTTLTWPTVSFGYSERDNRVLGYTTNPAMDHNRLASINTETGMGIAVHYEGDNGQSGRAPDLCAPNTNMPTSPSNDTKECFPVYWTSTGTTPTLDYFHHYVVTEVDVQDANATGPNQITTYTYSCCAAWHYDDNEVVQPAYRTYGQFRGYQTVDVRSGNTAINVTGLGADQQTDTRTTYFRGMDGDWLSSTSTRPATVTDSRGVSYPDSDQYAGLPLETTTYNGDGGSRVGNTITTYTTIGTTATRDRGTTLPALTANLIGRSVSTTYTALATGGDHIASTTTTYDTAGRPITVTKTATGAPTSCASTSYAVPQGSSWVRSAHSEDIVYNGACSGGTLMRDTRTFYDASTSLGTVTAGNPTEVDQAKDVNGSTLDFTKTSSSYDAFGRVTSTTQYEPGLSSGNRITKTAYTPASGGPLSQTVVTNPKNQTATTTYDPARANTTKVVDVAGRVTTATYDAMGRLTAVWKPGQVQGTDNPTQAYSYVFTPTAPLAVTTKTLVDPGNGAAIGYVSSVKIYDAFGNLRQTQTDGVGGGVAVTDSYPDSHGWVVLTDGPWYTSGSPSASILTTSASAINDRKIDLYDGTGRQTQVNDYNGTSLTSTTKTIYGGDRTTTLPPTGGTASTSIVDGAGNQTELDQYKTLPTVSGNVVSGGTYSKQTFAYDALGKEITRTAGATESSSAQMATWTMNYDLLGRLIQVVSPDAGTTATTYFDTGEVATTTDGAGRTLAFDYDILGRRTAKFSGTLGGTQLAAWSYDTATNGVGQLASSTSYAGGYTYTETTNGYDANGNPTGTTLTSTDPALNLLPSYKTSETWTSTHLQATETLASSATGPTVGVVAEPLKLWYDSHGDPNGLTGTNAYVSAATYSPFGELSQLVLGTNNETASLTFARDPQTRRITDINFSGQTATPQLEDMSYAYDLTGNITRITDVQGGPGSQTETQCFTYDGLDQLTQAWSAVDSCASDPTIAGNNHTVGGPQPYWTTWGYDDAGNRTAQFQHAVSGGIATNTSTVYTMGDSQHAHALSSTTTTGGATGSATYSYWPDGSMNTSTVNGAQSTYTYGPDGQLAAVQTAGGTSKYVRDADGNILTRTDPSGNTTLYLPGQEISIKGDKSAVTVNRYYSLGGITVATRVNTNNPVFLMSDLHGTNEVAVDPFSWTVTRRYIDPFGNPLGAAFGGAWPGDHGFLGKSVNAATGLIDLGAREYDPTTGRFICVDSVLGGDDALQANGYTYAENNPLTYTDPSGLFFVMPDVEGGSIVPGEGTQAPGSSTSCGTPEQRAAAVGISSAAVTAQQQHDDALSAGYRALVRLYTGGRVNVPIKTTPRYVAALELLQAYEDRQAAIANAARAAATHHTNWWKIGILSAVTVGLTIANGVQLGADPFTDGAEAATVTDLVGTASETADGLTASTQEVNIGADANAYTDQVESVNKQFDQVQGTLDGGHEALTAANPESIIGVPEPAPPFSMSAGADLVNSIPLFLGAATVGVVHITQFVMDLVARR